MEIQGKVIVIGEVQVVGSSGFRKRELVVKTEEQYPQTILIEFVQDNTDLLDKFKVGESVSVNINIRGREWVNPEGVTKYFNSIQGWRITPKGIAQPQATQTGGDDGEGDLPF